MDKKYQKRSSTGKNANRNPGFSASDFCSEINDSIQAFERNINRFKTQYRIWNSSREFNISELKELAKEVHEEQLAFNSTNLLFKQVNVESRRLRTNDDSKLDLVASIASLMTDAIGGITSIAQACNVDSHMKKFGEIMEKDAAITKPLHAARSLCFNRYKDVEEIIRRYHSETFHSTLKRITDAIDVEDMWLDLKSTNSCSSDISQVLEKVDVFFKQIQRAVVFNDICSSIESYVDSNPAVLDACSSVGKTVCDIVDTCSRGDSRNNELTRSASIVANRALIRRGDSEIRKLQRLVNDEDKPQAKLESKIREAIGDLEKEAREMKKLYESCSSGFQQQPSFTHYYNY